MTLADWVSESAERIRADGVAGVTESMYELYVGMWRNVGRRLNYGRSVFDDDWDVLVVLDACRWDLMSEVTDEYEFVNATHDYSLASSSEEWLGKTFDPVDTSTVAYVTANPFSAQVLDERRFQSIDEVWRYAIDDTVRTIPADAVTDRAIETHRNQNPERIVIHYMQPHYPFVPNPMDEGLSIGSFGDDDRNSVWDRLRKGEVARDEVWAAYRSNLEYVLDNVALLLENVDGDVLITADHGNLLGEYGIYGHPDYVPIPSLKRVPWCKTTAKDTGSYTPEPRVRKENDEREELLRDLGYRS